MYFSECSSEERRMERETTRIDTQPQHMMLTSNDDFDQDSYGSSAMSELNDSETLKVSSRINGYENWRDCHFTDRIHSSSDLETTLRQKRSQLPPLMNKRNKRLGSYHNATNRVHLLHTLPIFIILIISTSNCSYAFSISSNTLSFIPQIQQRRTNVHTAAQRQSILLQHATKSSTTSSPPDEIIQEVKPLTSSSEEKRQSVQRAWEEQVNLLEVTSANSDDLSATPFLDLFTDAGIASVKKVKREKSTSNSVRDIKPRGRPSSVPGAMSRATMMGINEMESRDYTQSQANRYSIHNNNNDQSSSGGDAFTTAISSSRFGRKKLSTRVTKSSSTILKNGKSNKKNTTTNKRGRGRPRKEKIVSTIDESNQDTNESKKTTSVASASTIDTKSSSSQKSKNLNDELLTEPRKKRGELQTLRPKSKKLKETEKEAETTGMMQSGRGSSRRGGIGGKNKDNEPPNLQRYYRTELLTSEEEYTLGMKIQFMINCELVYDGLCEQLERNPTIEEWANACGFVEQSTSREDNLTLLEQGYIEQIRPLKSDVIDPVEDADKFVGNGLVNASGPGRGRGRTKKAPPKSLRAYYDDSDIKFEDDYNEKLKSLKPLNRGTPMNFVELMISAKEAKRRMVQCNMRLVVSISKRYKHVGVNIADLVQEGSIGLTRAAEKFDPKKGFKFSTYASWWIQQAVFRSIAYHSRTIRLPVHVHNLLNRTRRVRLELQRILGRAPTNEEMAAELDMSLQKYNKMIRLTRKAISLDMAKYQNNPKDIGQESETSLGDTIDASDVIRDENSPEQSVDRVLFRDDLKEMLKILGEDERAVIYARYGIEDGLTRTVTTVAAQMGQTKSWVRSQECRALRKLRRPWYEKRLWEHQNSLTG